MSRLNEADERAGTVPARGGERMPGARGMMDA